MRSSPSRSSLILVRRLRHRAERRVRPGRGGGRAARRLVRRGVARVGRRIPRLSRAAPVGGRVRLAGWPRRALPGLRRAAAAHPCVGSQAAARCAQTRARSERARVARAPRAGCLLLAKRRPRALPHARTSSRLRVRAQASAPKLRASHTRPAHSRSRRSARACWSRSPTASSCSPTWTRTSRVGRLPSRAWARSRAA